MIDTIKIAIPINDDQDLSNVAFETPPSAVKNGYNGLFITKRNPLASERRRGIYRPRLTYCRRPISPENTISELLVEMSLPKLLFGNNFDEVSEKDFESILVTLSKTLSEMGILVSKKQIALAEVRKIDCCKNIILPKYVSVSSVISQLAMADISRTYDVDKTDFRNGGQIFHIHCNSVDIAFYDKVADLRLGKRSDKRSIEQDNYSQRELLEKLERHRLAVLRFEVRINGKRSLKTEFDNIRFDYGNMTFAEVYKASMANGILLEHWNKIFKVIPKVSVDSGKPIDLFREIIKDKNAKPQETLARLGLYVLLADCHDLRNLRNVFEDRFSKATRTRWRQHIREPPLKTQLKTLLHIGNEIASMNTVRLSVLGLD